jgi:hypothetical protein
MSDLPADANCGVLSSYCGCNDSTADLVASGLEQDTREDEFWLGIKLPPFVEYLSIPGPGTG